VRQARISSLADNDGRDRGLRSRPVDRGVPPRGAPKRCRSGREGTDAGLASTGGRCIRRRLGPSQDCPRSTERLDPNTEILVIWHCTSHARPPGQRVARRRFIWPANTGATQFRMPGRTNTPVTRTKRHYPAHGGTGARIAALAQLPGWMRMSWANWLILDGGAGRDRPSEKRKVGGSTPPLTTHQL
jgi:hypothetical protein